jgi:hypothetical protein
MAERHYAEVFQVLIGQLAEDCEINVVFDKARRVLGHAELFEPVRNLLHRRPRAVLPVTGGAKSLPILPATL